MIKILEKDLNKIKKKLSKGYFLRVTLVKSGCTGFEYKFIEDKNFDKEKDCIIEDKIIFFKTLIPKIENSTIYYKKNGLNETLELKNPNIVVECGCGQSFNF